MRLAGVSMMKNIQNGRHNNGYDCRNYCYYY